MHFLSTEETNSVFVVMVVNQIAYVHPPPGCTQAMNQSDVSRVNMPVFINYIGKVSCSNGSKLPRSPNNLGPLGLLYLVHELFLNFFLNF